VRRRNIREPFRWLYTKLKITARTNQIPIDLTFDEFLSFTKITQCTYCERQINWPSHGPQKLIENKEIRRAYYLDRKDNKRGYNLDNLCVCCSFCNMIKKDWLTYEEMLLLGKGLKEIRLKRQSA
jgi:5-methylcytosine-specific restriction endonuclease McrA